MSDQKNEDGVVQLVDAGVPADHGLSSLGLLMQLAGSILAGYAAFMLLSMLLLMRGLRSGSETMWMFMLFAMCIARSLMHRAAGTQLLYGNGTLREDGKTDRMGGMNRYIIFGATQSLAIGALLAGKFDAPIKLAAGMTVGLLMWPATLFVLFQLPRFSRYKSDLPLTEDKGFEGASILMTVLGTCGALFGAAILFGMLEAPAAFTKGAGVLLILAAAMLVLRSILHVQAGISGLRETSVDRSVELANRYANFGIISSFCAGGALLMFVMAMSKGGRAGDAAMFAIAIVCGMVWMLISWPMIVRRFFSDRQFADLLAGDEAPVHRRAPDAGLTGLGWLLFAHAIFGGSMIAIALIGGGEESGGVFGSMSMLGPTGMRSIWFSVGLTILQAWAGFELIRMSPQSRIIATVFGVVGAGVTLYINWPMLKLLKSMGTMLGSGMGQLLQIAPMAIALVIPVLTLILVNRKIAPTARARFKSRR
jgi:hypothetical protein